MGPDPIYRDLKNHEWQHRYGQDTQQRYECQYIAFLPVKIHTCAIKRTPHGVASSALWRTEVPTLLCGKSDRMSLLRTQIESFPGYLFVPFRGQKKPPIRKNPCLSVIKKSCLAFAARYDLRVTQPACLVIFFKVVFEDLHLNQNNRLESRRRCLHILQKMRYIPILLAFLFAVTSNARAQVYADVSVSHGAKPVQAGNV
jgi:hypothetical protein